MCVAQRYAVDQSSLGGVVQQPPERDLQICRLTPPPAELPAISLYPFTKSAGHKIDLEHRLFKNRLPVLSSLGYFQEAPAKSGVGIGVLNDCMATYDAPSVFFYVVNPTHPFFSGTVIIRVAHTEMVGWVGAFSEAPESIQSGYANLAQSTTREIGVSGGGHFDHCMEAAIMATTLILACQKYQFRFLALARADLSAKPCRLSVEATSEQETRRILAPHYILSFAACLPIPEAYHG